ncbi:MAG: SDR family oxidoreductase [Sphingomicrobium sp.]
MGDSLAGRVAIVTGSGRGIGRAEALCMAAEGAKIVVNDIGVTTKGEGPHSREPAESVVAEIRAAGGEAVASYDDVSCPRSCDTLVATALDTFGRIDILVNNAGQEGSRMIWKMTDERWDEVIRTHLYGSFYLIKRIAPHFRAQAYGRIINTSSDSGQGWPGEANYAAAKEGIIGLTKTVARELDAFGVTCNAIRPRAWTRMPADGAFVKKAEELRALGDPRSVAFADSFSAIRNQTPEQVAPFVAYLASEAAADVSGQVFTIGGRAITIQQVIAARTIFAEEGWTVESIARLFPSSLGSGLKRPGIETPPDACEFYGV